MCAQYGLMSGRSLPKIAPALGELFDKEKRSQADILFILQALLASSEGSSPATSWLQEVVSDKTTIYDKGVDAASETTGVGDTIDP